MKRQIDMPSEQIMRYFTPELYLQFNSENDEVADRADEAWESAIQEYRRHLHAIRDKMPSHVSKLSELCLHDAEVLGFERDLQPLYPYPEPHPYWAGPILTATAIISLKERNTVRSLVYMLVDEVRIHEAITGWPFSNTRKHWLYDEIDVLPGRRGMFVQRILFSDGSIAEIPFASVVTSAVSLPGSESESVAKRTA
jgi:hypothetical protein